MRENKVKMPPSEWVKAFQQVYGDALPEAQKQRVTNPTECAQAVQFRDLIRQVQKELQQEAGRMNHELEDAAAVLEFKIDNYRHGALKQKSMFADKPTEEREREPNDESGREANEESGW